MLSETTGQSHADLTVPVFLLAGQSNMAGRCLDADLPEAYVGRGIPLHNFGGVDFELCWNNDSNFGVPGDSGDLWLPLQCQPSPGLGSASFFGPEFGIAVALGPRLGELGFHKARFLKFAMGSTNMHSNWNPENTATEGKPGQIGHYAGFLEYCLRNIGDTGVAGMFWLQGESDSSKAKDANSYLENFKRFVEALRRDIPGSCHEIVVSPVVWKGKKIASVNQALGETENAIEHCTCIKSLDPSFGVQPADAGPGRAEHLTADGVCDIGIRMGRAMPLAHLTSAKLIVASDRQC